MPSQIGDDIYFTGNIKFGGTVAFPPNSLGDQQINPSAPITAPKLEHRFMPRVAQPYGVPAVAERKVVHRARTTGVVTNFLAGLTVANVGAATVTVDLLKNGASVLASPVVLTSTLAAFGSLSAAMAAGAAYVAGDVFEVAVTVSASTGTLGQGVFGEPVFTEGS